MHLLWHWLIGLVECKCPFSARNKSINEYITQPNCMLFKNDGIISLKSNHPYYFQAQHQMFAAGATYFDFGVFFIKDFCTACI